MAELLGAAAAGGIQPVGLKASGVQFDAVLEFNSQVNDAYSVLFARYWVATDYYCFAVVWAEPQGFRLHFCMPPAGLSAFSDRRSFALSHDFYQGVGTNYAKPLKVPRGSFPYMFGNYPIQDIHFADAEAAAARVYVGDLAQLSNSPETRQRAFLISTGGTEARAIRNLKVSSQPGVITDMDLFGSGSRPLKRLKYEYDSLPDGPVIRREFAVLEEEPLTGRITGEGVKVKLGNSSYEINEIPIVHHTGGRNCMVEYKASDVGGKSVPLPTRVEVRGGASGGDGLLRSARVQIFQINDLTAREAKASSAAFAALGNPYRKVHSLALEYWDATSRQVSAPDRETLLAVRNELETVRQGRRESLGELLKRVHLLMGIALLLNEEQALETNYVQYVSTLLTNGLTRMALVGGYAEIETTALRGHYGEAARLSNQWFGSLAGVVAPNLILDFAASELRKGNFWVVAGWLGRLSDTSFPHSADARFQRSAMRAVALAELRSFFVKPGVADKDLIRVQVELATRTLGSEQLKKLCEQSLNEARSRATDLVQLTPTQRELLDRVNALNGAQKGN